MSRPIVVTACTGWRPGVVEEVETPPGSCPQGCVFASVALPHRNEIAIMRSAHFLWRSLLCSVRFDVRTDVRETVCKDACKGLRWCRRTLVRACVGAGRGSWKGSRHRWQLPSGLWVEQGRIVLDSASLADADQYHLFRHPSRVDRQPHEQPGGWHASVDVKLM